VKSTNSFCLHTKNIFRTSLGPSFRHFHLSGPAQWGAHWAQHWFTAHKWVGATRGTCESAAAFLLTDRHSADRCNVTVQYNSFNFWPAVPFTPVPICQVCHTCHATRPFQPILSITPARSPGIQSSSCCCLSAWPNLCIIHLALRWISYTRRNKGVHLGLCQYRNMRIFLEAMLSELRSECQCKCE